MVGRACLVPWSWDAHVSLIRQKSLAVGFRLYYTEYMKCCLRVLVCLNALVLAALGHAQPQHYVAKFLADVTPFEKPYSPGGSSPIGIRRFTNSGTIVFGYGTAFYHGGQLKLASTAFGPGQQVVDANSSDEFGLSQISSFKFNTYASGIKGQVKNVYNNTGPTYLTLEYSCLSEDGSAGGYANGPYNAHSGFGIISNLRSKRDLIVSETCSIDQVLSEHSYVKNYGDSVSGTASTQAVLNDVPQPNIASVTTNYMRSDGSYAFTYSYNGNGINVNGQVTQYWGGGSISSFDKNEVAAFNAYPYTAHLLGYKGLYYELKSLATGLPALCNPYSSFIREDGEIATLVEQGGKYSLYQLTPVPEPSSMLLIMVGTLMVRRCRRRRVALATIVAGCLTGIASAGPILVKPIWNTLPSKYGDTVYAIANGQFLLYNSYPRIYLIDPRHRSVRWSLPSKCLFRDINHSDSRIAAYNDDSKSVEVYDLFKDQPVISLPIATEVWPVLSKDGNRVALPSSTFKIYSVGSGALLSSYSLAGQGILSYLLNNDGSKLYTSKAGGVLQVRNAQNGSIVASKTLFAGDIDSVDITPNNKFLVALSKNGWIDIVDPTSLDIIRTIRSSITNYHGMSLSADSTMVAVCSENSGTKVWRISDLSLVATIGSGTHYGSAFVNNDLELVTNKYVSDDPRGIYISLIRDPATNRMFVEDGSAMYVPKTGAQASFSPMGDRLLFNWRSSTSVVTAATYNVATTSGVGSIAVPGIASYEQIAALQPHGSQYIVGGSDWRIHVFQGNSAIPTDLAAHGNAINSVCYNRDGKQFAASSTDLLISIWDSTSLSLKKVIFSEGWGSYEQLKFADSDQSLYRCLGNFGLIKYSTASGNKLWSSPDVSEVALSSDDSRVAAGGYRPKLFNGASGSIIATMPEESGNVTEATASEYLLTSASSEMVTRRSFEDGHIVDTVEFQLGPFAAGGFEKNPDLMTSPGYQFILSGVVNAKMYRNPWHSNGMTCRAVVDVRDYKGLFRNWLADIEFLNPETGELAYATGNIANDFGDYRAHVEAPRGIFDIRVKCGTGLSKVFKNVDFSLGTEVIEAELINGDVNHDNYVGTDDYLLLSSAIDTAEGDANYLEDADLTGDGKVNTDDYLILNSSFDLYGE